MPDGHADTNNVYMVTVKAEAGTYMDTHDVMVMVTNVDEMGRVTFCERRGRLPSRCRRDNGRRTCYAGRWMDPDGEPGRHVPDGDVHEDNRRQHHFLDSGPGPGT